MSFLKKLFGGGKPAQSEQSGAILGQDSYKGFVIKAVEMRVGSEYQLAGSIEKEVAGSLQTHNFVRADRLSSKEDLVILALAKGRQIIDEQGDNAVS
jgi:hypothetical protein